MRALRLVLATGLITAMFGLSPAQATKCEENPKEPCGGCQLNRDFSTEDLRPIVCYI